MLTIQYRVIYENSLTEFVTVSGRDLNACLAAAVKAAKRYDPMTGKREQAVSIEFWERLSG